MIFVKDDNNKVYLKGTDVELSTAALLSIAGQLQDILEGRLDTVKPVNQKNARVLKSFNTEAGAKYWIQTQEKLGKPVTGAVITKSFDSYGDVSYAGAPVPSAPVHVVVEESMAPVAEVVSVKDADEMFKQMYKKGLIDVSGGMVMLSDKFYALLNDYTQKMLTDTLKAMEVDERGRSYKDVAESVLKATGGGGQSITPDDGGNTSRIDFGSRNESAPGLKISEEEASNHKGNTRQETLTPDGVGDATRQDPGTKGDPAPGLLISQEEADNKNATPTPISDAEAKSKQTKVEGSPQRELAVFKSLGELNGFLGSNKDFEGRPTTHQEKMTLGKRFNYIAVPKAPKDETIGAFGARKARR